MVARAALLGLLAAAAACGPALQAIPDEPVQPQSLPNAQPARRVIRIHPFGEQPPDDDEEPASLPATPGVSLGNRIARLTARRCFAELRRAGVAYRRERDVDDVRDAVDAGRATPAAAARLRRLAGPCSAGRLR